MEQFGTAILIEAENLDQWPLDLRPVDVADLHQLHVLLDDLQTVRHSPAKSLIGALRPRQWAKNMLVFVALGAAGLLAHMGDVLHAGLAFLAFCAVASAIYLVNDVRDIEQDRQHPKKCLRPIARGDVPVPLAIGMATGLMVGGFALALISDGLGLVAVMAAYVSISVAYSFFLKRIPFLEMLAVSSGFVLRALAGSVAIHAGLSSWFLLLALAGSLFIVIGKRHSEIALLGQDGAGHRPVLANYTPSLVRAAIFASLTVAFLGYAAWVVSRSGAFHLLPHLCMLLSALPIGAGLFHVLRRIQNGEGGSPEDLVFRDHFVQVVGLAWVALLVVGIYG